MKLLNWVKENKILMVLIFIGTLLRFYKIDFQSPWIDEIFTLTNTGKEKTFKGIYYFLKENDPHPPLYYFIIHSINILFDNTSLVARVVSALFGVAGLFAIYNLAKELFNKKIGIIAVALLSINFFHIYYSQEARMYTMLFFTTTISFIYLIKFIKNPSIKSAFWHSIFAALMIYTHFFALFALFSQYLILLFFVIKPYKTSQKKVFIYSAFSGILTFVLYIPALFILLKTSAMKSIWIPIPERDVYSVMFKEFFGYSEIAIIIALIGLIVFFVKLAQRKEEEKFAINPENEKQVFSFFVLFTWILISLFIPLLISFINLPMIVSRYFINIIPAILILVAAGLYYINNNVVRSFLIGIFMLFSVSDIVWVKKYYETPVKSQFREVTNEIIAKNNNKSKVVTYWSWLLPYFFKDSGIQVHPNTLEEYVLSLRKGSVEKESFWYLDGQSRPFNLSQEDQNYLNDNFVLNQKIEKIDSWAYYYESKTGPKNSSQPTKLTTESFGLKNFKTNNFDAQGNVLLFENTTLISELTEIEKGNYEIELQANSMPIKPINGENAHIRIKVSGREIGQISLSEKTDNKKNILHFSEEKTSSERILIIFDNDFSSNGQDRNVIIYSVKLKKIN
jgi:hypothetical protein